jgi:hypothetical protein
MIDLDLHRRCPKCKDTFYNEYDMRNIRENKLCGYCFIDKKISDHYKKKVDKYGQ